MDHIKSVFYFKSKIDEWRVEFVNNIDDKLTCIVYLNNDLYWDFGTGIPTTASSNPTKSKSSEILKYAKEAYKKAYFVRDRRDEKIKKILNEEVNP